VEAAGERRETMKASLKPANDPTEFVARAAAVEKGARFTFVTIDGRRVAYTVERAGGNGCVELRREDGSGGLAQVSDDWLLGPPSPRPHWVREAVEVEAAEAGEFRDLRGGKEA
jgi:hypothetical protein